MIDQHSPTWKTVEAWALAEIDALRTVLESTALNPEQTAINRGRIISIRHLLNLAEDAAKTTQSGGVEYGLQGVSQ